MRCSVCLGLSLIRRRLYKTRRSLVTMGRTAFVDRPGPHGMIIVLAGQKEREALLIESQALIDEVEHQIRLK
jgi:hypothetical protein